MCPERHALEAPKPETAKSYTQTSKTLVHNLKELLRARCSIPVSVQKILYDGHPSDDAQLLDVPMDLQLVLESFHGRPGQHRLDEELMEYAAKHGDAEVACRLLDAGADKEGPPTSDKYDGETVLLREAAAGHFEIAELLLQRDAVIDRQGRDGRWQDEFDVLLC